MDGGAGPDALFAGAGHDTLYGRRGQDALYGGGGFDVLEGGKAADLVFARAGDDTVVLSTFGENNGRDFVNCGGGSDTVYLDRDYDDAIRANCEIFVFVD